MSEDSISDATEAPLPPSLRFLRLLVTGLTAVMILGFLVVIGALVIRLNADPRPQPLALPDSIALPDGVTAQAFTQGTDWFAVVTSDDRILIYDRTTAALRQTITIE